MSTRGPQLALSQESVVFLEPTSPTHSGDDINGDLSGSVMLESMPTRTASTTVLEALGELDFRKAFLILSYCDRSSYALDAASDSWMAFMDLLLTECTDAEEKNNLRQNILQLVDIYYAALDGAKTGKKVEIPPDLKADKFPHFMERAKSYRSTSVLGVIFDKVASVQYEDMPSNEIGMLSRFSEPAPDSCLRIWEHRYNCYTEESEDSVAFQKYKSFEAFVQSR